MTNLHKSMGPGRDQTHDPWISNKPHYRLHYRAQQPKSYILAEKQKKKIFNYPPLLYLGLHAIKPVFRGLQTTKAQTSLGPTQSDHRLSYLLIGFSIICIRNRYITHFYCLAIVAGFYSDMVECLPLDPVNSYKVLETTTIAF